jgi:hypothetical protein
VHLRTRDRINFNIKHKENIIYLIPSLIFEKSSEKSRKISEKSGYNLDKSTIHGLF